MTEAMHEYFKRKIYGRLKFGRKEVLAGGSYSQIFLKGRILERIIVELRIKVEEIMKKY